MGPGAFIAAMPLRRDDAERVQVSRQHSFAFSRRDPPEVCPKTFTPKKSEGAGNAGCALHPRSRVQNGKRKRTRAYRFSGGTPTFPAQWFYGLLRDLPGDQDLFVTVAPRMMAEPTPGWAGFASAGLDANHEASGPHDFAVRSSTVRQRAVDRSRIPNGPALPSRVTPDAAASTASRPASLTIRIRPSVGQDGEGYAGDLRSGVKDNFG